MRKRRNSDAIVFDILNVALFCIIALMTLLPFVNLLAKSLSREEAVLAGRVTLWPIGFQLGTYRYVISQPQFLYSLRNSLIITLLGTAMAMVMTCMVAYPLSKPWLRGRKPLMLVYVFAMLFSGGMIPSYLLIRSLGMINSLSALIIPQMLSVYNMILLKNFFEELPESIEESARLDGASNFRILFSIILPMSLPAIATIGLFYAVGYWNDYMSGVLYITQPRLKPLQQYLFEIVTESQRAQDSAAMGTQNVDREMMNLSPDAIRAATIMLTSVPIMLAYPFLQRYFVTGLVIGSVKG